MATKHPSDLLAQSRLFKNLTGAEGEEKQFGPNALLIFEPGENHVVRAVDEELVFVAVLHGVSH